MATTPKSRYSTLEIKESDEERTLAIPQEFGYDFKYWKEHVELAKVHNKDFVGGLNSQMDSLLTFAGLFCGINTGFIVLSLGLLSPTPSDQTNALLRIMMAKTNLSTITELNQASEPWTQKASGVRSSYYLSASLSFGLLTSMGAVLGKQWLAYYERAGQVGTLDERAVKLQNKIDNVEIYSFHTFLISLLFLIQIAVLLFLLGFIDYLFDLHDGVAALVVVLVSLGFIMYAYTVITAALDSECPFQTPVSMGLRGICRSVVSSCKSMQRYFTDGANNEPESSTSRTDEENPNPPVSARVQSPVYSPMDRIWMPFKHILQGTSPDEDDQTKESKDEVPDVRSYATSVRWILETTSRQQALVEAARNIPALQDVQNTRRIFAKPDAGPLHKMWQYARARVSSCVNSLPLPWLSKSPTSTVMISHTKSQLSPHMDKSPAFHRLVSLYRGSLARYLTLFNAQKTPKSVTDEMIVYGRAVCHSLISSPNSKEGFERLSKQLSEFSSLAWLQGIKGELTLLLMCSLNHPRFWLYLENLDDSFHEIDASALPIYITGISIASLASSASNREQWVSKLAQRSLTRFNPSPSPRIIGLAARSLVYLVPANSTKMMDEFWEAYSSDVNYVSHVLEALRYYFVNVENVPACIEAYTALIKAFVMAINELFGTPDDFYSREARIQRAHHRKDLTTRGPNILAELEKILIDVSDRIQNLPPDIHTPLPFKAPSLHGLSKRNHLQEFRDGVLQAIKDGVLNRRWGFDLKLSGMALWKAAALLEPDSDSLPVVLDLMRNTHDAQSPYADLFHLYPSIASVITLALQSNRPVVRENSLSLLQDKAKVWFTDPVIIQCFAKADLATSLASHVAMGDTVHYRVQSLVGALAPLPGWRTKFLDAFYHSAVSIDRDNITNKSLDVIQLSLEVWFELNKPPYHSDVTDQTWQSEEMLAVVSQYVLNRVEVFRTCDSFARMQLENVGIAPSLQEYVKRAEQERMGYLRSSAAGQQLAGAFAVFGALFEHNN
ncbi:hypothetical protein FRC03_009754 [Tulasnella sp. 419]|nr:hypothetical protein FRC03_009754 [Tulasnella sp. 419]